MRCNTSVTGNSAVIVNSAMIVTGKSAVIVIGNSAVTLTVIGTSAVIR